MSVCLNDARLTVEHGMPGTVPAVCRARTHSRIAGGERGVMTEWARGIALILSVAAVTAGGGRRRVAHDSAQLRGRDRRRGGARARPGIRREYALRDDGRRRRAGEGDDLFHPNRRRGFHASARVRGRGWGVSLGTPDTERRCAPRGDGAGRSERQGDGILIQSCSGTHAHAGANRFSAGRVPSAARPWVIDIGDTFGGAWPWGGILTLRGKR